MTGLSSRPLLFLDVDGTVLPAGGVRPTTLEDWNATWQNASNPHLATITTGHGRRLLSMPCDLMWATAWMADANEVISPLLGLPELPVVELGELPGIDDPVRSENDPSTEIHWKTRALVELAAGRPFIWIDDEIIEADRTWVRTHHSGHALLHRVDPDVGLTGADLAEVEAWLRSEVDDRDGPVRATAPSLTRTTPSGARHPQEDHSAAVRDLGHAWASGPPGSP